MLNLTEKNKAYTADCKIWYLARYLVSGQIFVIRPEIWHPARYLVSGQISIIRPDIWYPARYLVSGQISGIRPDIWYPARYLASGQLSGIWTDISGIWSDILYIQPISFIWSNIRTDFWQDMKLGIIIIPDILPSTKDADICWPDIQPNWHPAYYHHVYSTVCINHLPLTIAF